MGLLYQRGEWQKVPPILLASKNVYFSGGHMSILWHHIAPKWCHVFQTFRHLSLFTERKQNRSHNNTMTCGGGETKKRLFPKKYTDRHVHVAIWDIIFHSLVCALLLRKTILAVGKTYTKPWVEVMKLGFFLTYWIIYLPSSGQLDVAHCSFRTQWSSNDMWRSHVDWNFSYASSRHIYHSYRRQPWKGKMPSDPVTQTKHEQNL